MKWCILIAFCFVFSIPIWSQTGKITGQVLDAKTGLPLVGANVMVRGTWLGAMTDLKGKFEIKSLSMGAYEIEVSMMGYEKVLQKEIRVESHDTLHLLFRLKPSLLHHPPQVVTASKRKQAIENTPVSVDVIGSDAIRTRNVTTLDEVLVKTAGVGIIDGQVDVRGSSGFNWAAGSRILMLVDGHPLISGDTGGINWDIIPVEEIERVEVVKGAGSALYGSNAMAGMINVITREPSAIPQTRVRMTYGFYDTPAYESWRWTDRFLTYRIFKQKKFDFRNVLGFQGIDLSHSRVLGQNVGVLFTLGRKTSSGYYQNGDYDRWNFMGKCTFRGPLDQFMVSSSWASEDHGDVLQWLSQSGALEVPPQESKNRILYTKGNLALTYRRVANSTLAYTVKSHYYQNHWENHYQDNQDYATNHKFGTEFQTDWIWKLHALTFGTEWIYTHSISKIYGKPTTYDWALYGEDELKLSKTWILTFGVRFDWHKVQVLYSESELSPRLGMVWHTENGPAFRFSLGRGFRAPSIAEVFADITVSGFRVVANPDLKKAERAWNLELGANHTIQQVALPWIGEWLGLQLKWDVAGFWHRYNNMIDVDYNPAVGGFQFMNMGEAQNVGGEVRLQVVCLNGHLSGDVGYTYLDARDIKTQKMLHYRSRHRLNTGGELKFGKWRFGLDYRYASRVEEVVNVYRMDERVPMHVVDARVQWDLSRVSFAVEGKNVLNYHYTLRQRMLEPIRHFVFTFRGNF